MPIAEDRLTWAKALTENSVTESIAMKHIVFIC